MFDVAAVTPHVSVDAQQQLIGDEGLGHVVIGTGLETRALVYDVVFRREKDNGNATSLLAHLLADVEAIHAGHHHVEKQQIGVLVIQQPKPLSPAKSPAELVARFFYDGSKTFVNARIARRPASGYAHLPRPAIAKSI